MLNEGPRTHLPDRSRWVVSGSDERQSSTVSSPDKDRDRHDIGETKRGHTAWYAEQRTKAGGSKETGVIPMRYLVVVEKGPSSYGAHVPDLPGCIAAGETKEEVLSLIREAIEFHIEGLKQEGQPIPGPVSMSELVEVAAA